MADYLQNIGQPLRYICVVICLFAALLALSTALLVGNEMIRRGSFYYEGKPLWVGAVVVTALGFASGYIALRLLFGQISTNGSTLLSNWFIQIFGIAFLCGICLAALHGNHPELLIEGPSIAIAMIFIGRHATKKRRIRFLRRLISLNAADRENILSQMSPENRQKIQALLDQYAYNQNDAAQTKNI